jgi:hypothetical protein
MLFLKFLRSEPTMNQEITPAVLAAATSGSFDNFIAAITPGGIEAQEAAGQTAFVNSTTLPKKMLGGCIRKQLEQMGIQFGADADDLFVEVRLPEGWKKQATDHAMWSELLDEKGRKRANIFYKAAFYDREAHVSLCRRYTVSSCETCDGKGKPARFNSVEGTHLWTAAKDCDTVIHVIGIRKRDDWATGLEHEKQADSWLAKTFPDYKNPLAYWE